MMLSRFRITFASLCIVFLTGAFLSRKFKPSNIFSAIPTKQKEPKKISPWSVSGQKFDGFNNQRQTTFITWVLAYINSYSMMMDKIHANKHIQTDYPLDDVWNLDSLSKYVHVVFNQTKLSPVNEIDINDQFHSKYEAKINQSIHLYYRYYWGRLLKVFPFIGGDDDMFDKLMESFEYNDIIMKRFRKAKKILGKKYYAVHMRFEKYPRHFLMDCEKYGWGHFRVSPPPSWEDENSRRHMACVNKSTNEFINPEEAIEKVFTDEKIPIYIATNNAKHPIIQSMVENSRHKILLAENLKVKGLNSLQLSCLDQVIVSEGVKFMPALYSSWSEYAIFRRKYVGAGKKTFLLLNKIMNDENYIFPHN